MASIGAALEGLEPDALTRVIEWARARYGPKGVGSPTLPSDERRGREGAAAFKDLADLLDAARAEGERERVLAAAYWVQEVEGLNPFESQAVNTRLKEIGYGVPNITRSLGELGADRPALVTQVRKSGRTRQARKSYRLTVEGVRALTALTARSGVDLESRPA